MIIRLNEEHNSILTTAETFELYLNDKRRINKTIGCVDFSNMLHLANRSFPTRRKRKINIKGIIWVVIGCSLSL